MHDSEEWLQVESLDLEGQGVAHRADGKVVFIEGALPGESVRVRCTAPPASVLRFGAVLEPALLRPGLRRERRSFDVELRWDPTTSD